MSQNIITPKQRTQRYSANSIQDKLQQFHLRIRQKDVETRRHQIRQQLLSAINEDYPLLKHINLRQTINSLVNLNPNSIISSWSRFQQITANLHSYCVSKQADHMYQLLYESSIDKLINLVKQDCLPLYQKKPRQYIRILWILCNYTNHVGDIPVPYIQIIRYTLLNVASIPLFYEKKAQFMYFSHSQVKSICDLFFLSLSNANLENQVVFQYFLGNQNDGLIRIALNEGFKLFECLKHENISDSEFNIKILQKILRVFQKFVVVSSQKKQIREIVYGYDYQIMNFLLNLLQFAQFKQLALQLSILQIFSQFFLHQSQNQPKIMISHNFTLIFHYLKEITEKLIPMSHQITNYSNMLQIEGQINVSLSQLFKQAKGLLQRMLSCLSIVKIMFVVNIPEGEDQKAFYQTYQSWIDDYLIQIIITIFNCNDAQLDKAKQIIVSILQDVCLEEQFCQIILDQMAILNKIFYFCQSKVVGMRLRIGSLGCLANMIIIALDGPSGLRDLVLQLLARNNFINILAEHIGQFVNIDFNQRLLIALELLLKCESCQINNENVMWIKFCEMGGKVKLQKMISVSSQKERKICKMAENILKEYDCHDSI